MLYDTETISVKSALVAEFITVKGSKIKSNLPDSSRPDPQRIH
jgi:hypothetical protein